MFAYTPDFLPSSIILIGAGGTGSRLMPMMAQLVKTCLREHNPNAWLEHLPIFVIDGDTVEEKNLLRQNFIHRDVGKPKASVLASRYSTAFGIPIYPSIQYVPELTSWRPEILGLPATSHPFSFQHSVVIMAVDSANARRTILRQIFRNRYIGAANQNPFKCFIIDAGNEDAFGQVKFFTGDIITSERTVEVDAKRYSVQPLSEHKVNFIPFDSTYYEKLGSSSDELSCAELPQTLAVNALAATWICSILQNFLYLKPVCFDGIRFSMNGSVSTEFNTPKRWISRWMHGFNDNPEIIPSILLTRGHRLDVRDNIFSSLYKTTQDLYKAAGMDLKEDGELVPIPVKPPPLNVEPKASVKAKSEDGEVSVEAMAPPELQALPIPEVAPLRPLNPPTPRVRRRAPIPVEQINTTPTATDVDAVNLPF